MRSNLLHRFHKVDCFTPLLSPTLQFAKTDFHISNATFRLTKFSPSPFHQNFLSQVINLRSFKGQERGRTSPVLNKTMLITDFYISSQLTILLKNRHPIAIGCEADSSSAEAISFIDFTKRLLHSITKANFQFARTDFHISNDTLRLTKFFPLAIQPKLRKSINQLAKFQRPGAWQNFASFK